jgi:hypothetical protein
LEADQLAGADPDLSQSQVLENRLNLPGYEGELRQLTVMELGHQEPTVLLTNHRKLGPVELVTRYAQRMLIETESPKLSSSSISTHSPPWLE